MKDEPTHDPETLTVGESLTLLRRSLPLLGILMVVAVALGLYAEQLRISQALVLAGLGISAAVWAWNSHTCTFTFERATMRVVIRDRGPIGVTETAIPFSAVRDVIIRIIEGKRSGPNSPLVRLMSFQMRLVTNRGEFPLSCLAMQSMSDCTSLEQSIWRALGRQPPEPLLTRSYRFALQANDRLQAISLRRLMEPSLTLTEAEALVRKDGLIAMPTRSTGEP